MEYDWLLLDICRISKDDILEILTENNIPHSTTDTVADLRPKLSLLKRVLKLGQSIQRLEATIQGVITSTRPLTPGERTANPDLAELEDLIAQAHVYYEPPDDNTDYEDVDLNLTLQPQNQNRPQIMAEKLPLITAGTYSGYPNESSLLFLEKFELAATCNQWTENSKITLFPAHLNATALTWIQLYKQRTDNITWNNLKAEFLRTFSPLAQSNNLQLVMEHKVQTDSQPVLNYFLDIVQTCRTFDPNTPEKTIVDYVISGLRPEICEKVLLQNNDTLINLERNLKAAELQVLTQNQNKAKYHRVNQPQNQVTPTNDNKQIQALQGEINRLSNTIATLTFNKQTTRQGPTNRNYQQNNREQPRFTPRNPKSTQYQQPTPRQHKKYCNICKKTNHNTIDCWYTDKNRTYTHKFCAYCKRNNHTITECYRVPNNKFSRQQHQPNPKNG